MLIGPLNSLHGRIPTEIFLPFAMGCLSCSYWLIGVLYRSTFTCVANILSWSMAYLSVPFMMPLDFNAFIRLCLYGKCVLRILFKKPFLAPRSKRYSPMLLSLKVV